MIARLFLVLLLFGIALPATAAMPCHDGEQAMTTMPMPSHHDKAVAAHSCIGCIPPSTWRSASVAAPLILPAAAPIARIVTIDLGRAVAPTIPPPRAA